MSELSRRSVLGGLLGTALVGVTGGTAVAAPPVPRGVPGYWAQIFADEFNGGVLDRSKWNLHDGKKMNGVNTRASNVVVTKGEARLALSDGSSGAMISTSSVDGEGQKGFELMPGQVAEARIWFPGNSSGIYNWPAWWAVSDPWAAGGEHDIAEGLVGNLCIAYHRGEWPATTRPYLKSVPGGWANSWHTYSLHRKAKSATVRWDGKIVASYLTDDNGAGEALTLNIGRFSSEPVIGARGAMRVSYVRAWSPVTV